ncbi:MAG TPA: hypothetical protein DHV59_17095 [Oxalobacteraceae bacterium]|nr:hypothetical protein [Oxalobacteraceae bacterium]
MSATTPRHTLLEDIQALLSGTLLVSLGVALVGKAGLITGGVVGLAFLMHYATGIGFGILFFLVNLPFYWLALKKLGRTFVLKTFTAVALLSVLTEIIPRVLEIERVNPVYAAVTGGLLMGVGLLILFRHRASLGGLNVLVLYLQERYGWRAGVVQLAFDVVILLASVPMISAVSVGISLIGAVVLNLTLAVNHRPGRYMAI